MAALAKLMQARIALQKLPLKKSGHNKFAGYQYFELGDFLPQVQDIFAGLGLAGIVSFGADIATLSIVDTVDGDSFVITCPMSTAALKGCHEVQNLGAVLTYIRRYLWVSALEIVEHDALDATTGKDKPAAPVVSATQGCFAALSDADKEKATAWAHGIRDAIDAEDLLSLHQLADEVKECGDADLQAGFQDLKKKLFTKEQNAYYSAARKAQR